MHFAAVEHGLYDVCNFMCHSWALRSPYMTMLWRFLAPPPPRVARSNRKRQPQKECSRLEEKTEEAEITICWLASAHQIHRWSCKPPPGPDLPLLTRFWRSLYVAQQRACPPHKPKVKPTCRTTHTRRRGECLSCGLHDCDSCVCVYVTLV